MTKKTDEPATEPLTAHGGGYLAEPFDADERADALLAIATTQPEIARLLSELFAKAGEVPATRQGAAELAQLDERVSTLEALITAEPITTPVEPAPKVSGSASKTSGSSAKA